MKYIYILFAVVSVLWNLNYAALSCFGILEHFLGNIGFDFFLLFFVLECRLAVEAYFEGQDVT